MNTIIWHCKQKFRLFLNKDVHRVNCILLQKLTGLCTFFKWRRATRGPSQYTYQYRISHYEDKGFSRPSYLYNRIHTWEDRLYIEIGPAFIVKCSSRCPEIHSVVSIESPRLWGRLCWYPLSGGGWRKITSGHMVQGQHTVIPRKQVQCRTVLTQQYNPNFVPFRTRTEISLISLASYLFSLPCSTFQSDHVTLYNNVRPITPTLRPSDAY